ncbi:cupin [Grosmannia clavigera kw1407]|uniref:Cupin n=1 Tax=Grosmannia clavigera (strain kw1407 / UAMH 11150) TaxID=655863 RepID=F0XJL4_GROCL|nr:cupin [Grosmannia clavigera kw1407]EFX02060.1 cupin [Grosmannia clavigera kw1407]
MMAGLLSLVQELLPMIIPGSVEITRAEEIRPASPLTDDDEPTTEPTGAEKAGDVVVAGEEEDASVLGRSSSQPNTPGPGIEPIEPTADSTARESRIDGSLPERPPSRTTTEKDNLHDVPGRPEGPQQPSTSNPLPPTVSPRRRRTGVSMRDAMVHKSDRMCAVVLTVKPLCSTVVFHNAEQESIVYAVAGTAVLSTLSEDHDAHDDSDSTVPPPPPARHVLGPGDFAFIPAWVEHQVSNESPDTDVVWVVVRTGPEPTVVPLSEWGGPEA